MFACRRQVLAVLSMNIRGHNNSTFFKLRIPVESLLAQSRWPRHTLKWFYTTYAVCRSRILFRFVFKFVSLRHILVGHTKIFFCERLNFNNFLLNPVHFTIFVLTWYYFTTYSIVLPMQISYRLFHTFGIYLMCFVYITAYITCTGFYIITSWHYFYCPRFYLIIRILLLLFVISGR